MTRTGSVALHDLATAGQVMFTDYRPNKGYDEYFSATDQPRSSL